MEDTKQNQAARHGWFPWAISALGVTAVVAFIVYYPPANSLAKETFSILFTLFFTPFLLEFICIVAGFLIVISLNNRRRAKEEKDEWVYLHQVEPGSSVSESEAEAADIPEPLRRRIEDVPYTSLPEQAGPAERSAEIGGLLDLQMISEASEALLAVPANEVDTLPFLLHRIRLAFLKEDWKNMDSLTDLARGAGASDEAISTVRKGGSA